MTKMNNRAYGIIGVKAEMANWNADFTGKPKSMANGTHFGSDKALKYPIRQFWKNEGHSVLYIKSMVKGKKDTLQVADLKERYESLFGEAPANVQKTLENILQCVDVLNFGGTFATKEVNIGVTGPVQFVDGLNVFLNTEVGTQDILSPFRNSNNEDADRGTIGKKIFADRMHYIYPFSVNPNNVKEWEGLIEGFEGYTVEAYEAFKLGARLGPLSLNTNTKAGCFTEFALFVELEDESKALLPNLNKYVDVTFEGEKAIYNLDNLADLLGDVQNAVKTVEIHYNPLNVEVETAKLDDLDVNVQYLQVFTGSKLK
ncbi:type I CRISPR-associated protein Cas7 [Bacillus thuringiensis]|uniref:type I CRISPR-associated protein Cas7 n=1 Tax=Bacillus thuringiensis TaxID=1428 RepID=UPI0021D6703E|nr:type I CRISPR-associated protein Cas7 [Bacillus thuringiensis]MCU7667770.1 type I CRISPR-associated protein Cas7 [Bacillus thuringiensis]